jgi:hypothetical protein
MSFSSAIIDKTADPSTYGHWEPIKYKFKYLPVHIALLHTGKVLAFGGSGNDPDYLNNPFPAEIFEPNEIGKDNNGKVYTISNNGIEGDIFCAGHTYFSDGKLLIAGGTYKYDGSSLNPQLPPFSGLEHAYIFDPISLSWQRVPNMKHGRWYPTCIMVSDGRIITMAGLSKQFPWVFLSEIEAFYNDSKEWKTMKGSNWRLPLYPRLHLLPNGEIFYAGSFNTHYVYPFIVTAFPSATFNINTGKWKKIGNPHNKKREEGTTVLLPLVPPEYHAKVLLIGGGTFQGDNAISDIELIDFSSPDPKYKHIGNMKHPRYYNYAVILPDQSILVLGGKTGKKGHHHPIHEMDKMMSKHDDGHHHNHNGELPHTDGAVLEPELYKPDENKWYPMADMKVDRLYHSNALLLPDGRVMTAGSNPERKENELRIEIFNPPYLFRGERPQINNISADNITYGSSFEIEINNNQAEDILSVALIHPTVTTHCVNVDQRYVGLEFDKIDSTILKSSIPKNKNIIPPGYYMLFIINKRKVPSIARFVLIN